METHSVLMLYKNGGVFTVYNWEPIWRHRLFTYEQIQVVVKKNQEIKTKAKGITQAF